ncbi:MAG: FAD/NAD(P)-binding protein [Candidatus Aminicenantes bacterium]|nr:FAD/NAD(P)-binding protein [Candidatus Aminicenantes bacterium]
MDKERGNTQKKRNSSLYLPEVATLINKREMTPDDSFFEFQLKNRSLGHLPGQFAEISVPGIGEAPISISSPPSKSRKFEMVIRRVGSVTGALHALKVGDSAGIRGPFGAAFPMAALKGRNLLFISGGIGLVPARSAILYALEHRQDYKDIIILFGCREPAQRLFTDALAQWQKREDIIFHESVDRTNGAPWHGNVGVITTLLPKLGKVNPVDTYAIVVGPPVMYKYVIMGLHDMDFSDDHIILSLERRMKCGVGKCGHCQMNDKYVCRDGPVFNYDRIKHLQEAI